MDTKTERAELFYSNWSNEALLARLDIIEKSVKDDRLIPNKTPAIRSAIEQAEDRARVLCAVLERRISV